MIPRLLISSLFVFALISCNHSLVSKKVVKNDIEMLYGPLSVEQLYFDYPQWQKIEEAYKPDSKVIEQLSELKGPFDVKIFLATWCSDSRREVPHFMKIINQAGLSGRLKMELFAVDRKLKLNSGLAKKYNIKRVPTFVFFRQGKELGQIVESPEALLLEQDVYTILSGASK
ncbi:hypothetical protein B6I21_06810 [candidate division KSB1 bacterium 4572_119]|nr:MAG: hypothetical protein B6I21_06810 [candidate division KSB1 bacterium 4572_119]